jgi:hypothetical protein
MTRPGLKVRVQTPPGVGVSQEAVEPSWVPDMPESHETEPLITKRDSQGPQTATQQQGVLQGRMSQLESAPVRRTYTITGPDSSSERSQLLRAAFGPSALAHREMRIDIVTAVSVLVISAKLLTVRSPWVSLTAAYFIVYGWLLVQSLLLIFHS